MANTTDFEFKDIDKMRRKMATMIKKMPDEVARALYAEAQIEATESRKRTPVRDNILRPSTEVQDPVIKGDDISVTIAVGGPSIDYAIVVHEDLDAYHEVGQAKFLESTINESKPFMARRVGKRIKLNRTI